VFLIWILVIGILSLFFLFYFNRLFATAVSYGIRAYTWYKFKAYIDISALQISLLGGRVFFKSIRYHAHNVTVYVYEGHVTWRYWLPRVQEAEVFQEEEIGPRNKQRSSSTAAGERDEKSSSDEKPRARSRSIGKEEKGGGKPRKELPCRISVKVTGVEAFIYNRSPLYDAVVEATMKKAKEAAKGGNRGENLGKSQTSSSQGSKSQSDSKASNMPQKVHTRTTVASATAPEKPQIPAFLRIFPIKVECKRAAAALGNENTTNVLTAKAERAVGTVDAGHAGPLDLWKLIFSFSIEKVKVAMRPNKDFKEFQLDAGQRLLRERELATPEPEKKAVKEAMQRTRGIWNRLRYLFHRHGSAESLRTASMKSGMVGHQPPKEQLAGQSQWHGLTRYLEDRELNEHEEWQTVEYAKVSDLVDCDRVTMRFYWDMSGPVSDGTLDSDTLLGSKYEDDINGMAPPEYGMDLGVYGGVVQYGPWADRQRINLQQIFFPAPYVDAVPAKPLKSGELRVCTVFKIKVIVEEDVVLRVPAREESKDSKWKGRADKAQPAASSGATAGKGSRHWRKHKRKSKQTQAAIDARPFGWLDITVKKDSVVNYIMDMFPRPAGYRNNLDLDVKGVEMQSSVNHGLLWRSGPVSVQADISQPIEWNTLRKWPFDIVINDMELFILRDHLFLIIDLVNDWSSGAPSDFWTFVPYNYQLEMTFKNFVMYLNVNDANIINDPADFDRNDFLTIEGKLHAVLGIPMENYRPKSNKITFDVLAQNLSMRQYSPPKSTFSVYVEDRTMATLPKLTLNGSYTANQEAKVGNVDVLRMDIVGTGLSLKAFGFYVRQLVSIKENYFGDYMHFKTLEEFQAASDDLEEANAKTASFPKPTSINELDVILCIVAEEATVMFPTNLYSCKEFVRAELPRADLDLRIVSYYLDMGLQLSPISFLTGVSATKDEDDDDPVDRQSSTQFWVAHVDLNGHRAFGLPPNEDAYVSQWDIDIGKISGEMSSKFVRDLALAGRAFAFSIQDAENALPVSSPAVALDASFVQVRTDTVRLWMHVGGDALLIDLNPVAVDVNGWASSLFSQRVNVLVPLITFACVNGRSASRHRSPFVKKRPVRTYAFLQTGVSIDVVGRKLHFESTISQVIHDPGTDQNAEHVSVLIKVVPGIRVYVEPHLAVTVSKLIERVLPNNPEEVMDSFHMSVMGAISSRNSERIGPTNILEISASLPAAHMRVVALEEHKDEIADQIDITMSLLELAVRVRTHPRDNGARNGRELMKPAVSLHVDDALVWLALTSTHAFHVSLREAVVSVNSPQTTYLTELALKLVPLITGIMERFDDIFTNDTRRLQWLTYVLTQNGEIVSDPPFMARMLYILRAFPGHFRNTDSWKILSRFRNILMHLPKEKADELEAHCRENRLAFPAGAPERTLESWTQWRNWDVPYVNQTMAFKMIWRPDELNQESSPDKPPLTVTFRSESLRIALESEKTSSEIVIEETSLGMENIPPTRPEGLMLVDENMRTKTLIQLHMGIFALNLDWELLKIAEDVISLNDKIQQVSSKLQAGGKRTTRQAIDDGLARHDVHIVLSTDTGSITLQTINVRHVSQAEGLKVSVIGTTQASEQFGQCASAIINVDRAITELCGTNTRIWQTLLISPSLYIDCLQPAPGADGPATITLALAYEDLQIRITEQVPGILHLIDLIILDEVAKCQKLAEIVQPRPSSSATASPAVREQKTKTTQASETTFGSVPPKLHVAVLAGNIHLEVSLLQNLGYMLEGVAASVRVAPRLTKDKVFSIDFDVGKQKHAFVNTSEEERHIQGLLDVPPINGHVGLELGNDETSVSVATTIERVEVDAGAMQGVIGVMNQPEVQDVFKSIKAGVEDIQHHVEYVFPKNELEKPKPVKEQRILFDARLALLGIRISAHTPTAKDAHRYRAMAEVELGTGPLHATASNRETSKDANPLIPEVRAHIQDIGAALRIKERGKIRPCGNATMSIRLHFNNIVGENGVVHRELKVRSDGIEINANPETASTVVDVINHLEDRIKRLDLSKEVEYLRKLRDERRHTVIKRIKGDEGWPDDDEMPFSPEDLLSITTTIELTEIQATWLVDSSFAARRGAQVDDLVFSIQSIEFKTRGGHEARLNIQNIQLQLVKRKESKQYRALNSALLPEVGFSVAYWSEKGKNVKLALKATGKPLDLRLESKFMFPVSAVQKSIELARDKFKTGTATWQSMPTTSGAPRTPSFDTKRLSSVLVEADFAGAQVYIQGSGPRSNSLASIAAASQQHGTQHGRYGQFAADGALMQTTLTAPGISLKMEYNRDDVQPRLNGELMIDASTNMLAPNVVPLVLEISNSVKEVVRSQDEKTKPQTPPKPDTAEDQRPSPDQSRAKQFFEDDNIVATTPAKIFGKTKVDLGFRIAKQEFGLSCQPIARVDAKASLEGFYLTMNTIDSDEHGHFFAMSAVMTKLGAQVKHMYSREPTFSYEMDSIVLSAMNNKHLSGSAGISAILNINPTKIAINGKQFQDLLLFREIWLPPEIRKPSAASPAQGAAPAITVQRPDEFVVQKYQTFAAAAAFPWNATVNITELAVDVDLGQSIGKSSFRIINLWASQQKSSNWEQNLCIGLDEMGVDSTGRMSGFIHLGKLGVRTSIKWPEESTQATLRKTPLIQASIGVKELKAKAAFDYQAFAFGDIGNFDFLMYNVREQHGTGDRLVAVLDCGKAHVFCTSSSPSQAVALYQAFDRLIHEKQSAYMQSLKEIEKHLRRESTVVPTRFGPQIPDSPVAEKRAEKSPISLHTDVVVTMGGICFGVYPSTFFDSQMLKLEASNIQARFAVGLEGGRITCALGMTLGQLQVALSSVRRMTAVPKALEMTADEVINSALNAKGGIILRVPQVVASMQTWQAPKGCEVDYIFKSLFDGKIDVGWNLSRINFIKGMWESGYRALASRLDKSLPESAVKIKAEGPAADSPSPPSSSGDRDSAPQPQPQPQEKITAEINLPQSRYEYHALEPAVIETPQLRDMGEATPPLEWVGLHRDRLPNVTHQIIIVTLLEVCKEVEDAYGKILGGA
ncbi:uncharacterized protein MYCFIDRAFT_113885, partial [Pseudocercospora fijiensis CIRAD86]